MMVGCQGFGSVSNGLQVVEGVRARKAEIDTMILEGYLYYLLFILFLHIPSLERYGRYQSYKQSLIIRRGQSPQ